VLLSGHLLLIDENGYEQIFIDLSCILCVNSRGIFILFVPDMGSLNPPIQKYWQLYLFHIEFLTGLGSPHNGESIYLQLVLSIESLVKVLVFSVMTGLIFIRFTKPVARIRFSKLALVTNHLNQRQFMFRVMHERPDALVNIHVELTLSINEKTPAGHYWRSFHSLPLRRSGIPSFSLPWAVMHIIDSNSRMYHLTSEDLSQVGANFIVVLNATDQITGGAIHAIHHYRPSDIIYDRAFDDVMITKGDGSRTCDMGKFDLLKDAETV